MSHPSSRAKKQLLRQGTTTQHGRPDTTPDYFSRLPPLDWLPEYDGEASRLYDPGSRDSLLTDKFKLSTHRYNGLPPPTLCLIVRRWNVPITSSWPCDDVKRGASSTLHPRIEENLMCPHTSHKIKSFNLRRPLQKQVHNQTPTHHPHLHSPTNR